MLTEKEVEAYLMKAGSDGNDGEAATLFGFFVSPPREK